MPNTKPFVQAACLCENVILEPNGVASLIRIVDKFEVTIPEDLPLALPPGFPVTMFIALKSGDMKGTIKIRIQARRPDGTFGDSIEWPVALTGGSQGGQLRVNFTILNPQTGLYWFDVLFGDELLTSVPADVKVVKKTLAEMQKLRPPQNTTLGAPA
jgi:hypothetical protein